MITLLPDFHAESGSEFIAQIGDCITTSVERNDIANKVIITKVEQPANFPQNINIKIIPNPFVGDTTIQLIVEKSAVLDILVHDLTGKQIATLAKQQYFAKGQHEYNFDATGQMPGMYLLTIKTADQQVVEKMILMR